MNFSYQRWATLFDSGIRAALDQAIDQGLMQSRMALAPVAVFWVIGIGVMFATGRMGVGTAASRIGWLGLAIAITTSGFFGEIVRPFFMVDLPQAIASAVAGAAGLSPTGDIGSARQFDVMSGAVWNMAYNVKAAAGWSQMYLWPVIYVVAGALDVATAVMFAVWLIVRLSISLVVAALAYMPLLLLFAATRMWIMEAVGKIVGLLMHQLMVGIMLLISIEGAQSWMREAINAPGDIDLKMRAMFSIVAFMVIALCVLLKIPSLVSGGAGWAISGATAAVTSRMGGGAAAAGAANVLAGPAGAAARRALTQFAVGLHDGAQGIKALKAQVSRP